MLARVSPEIVTLQGLQQRKKAFVGCPGSSEVRAAVLLEGRSWGTRGFPECRPAQRAAADTAPVSCTWRTCHLSFTKHPTLGLSFASGV